MSLHVWAILMPKALSEVDAFSIKRTKAAWLLLSSLPGVDVNAFNVRVGERSRPRGSSESERLRLRRDGEGDRECVGDEVAE